jgi:Mlc titration factor MtfA (ptsG expression regulator)
LSNATTIDSALNYIRNKQQEQQQQKWQLVLDLLPLLLLLTTTNQLQVAEKQYFR